MRISFAEAAFIRYFEPRYNKVYNTGFPHQRLKILKKLYDFDFAGIVVEASVEDHGMRLYSEKQSPNFYHIAKFDLHDPATRKSFFFAESLPLDKNRSILNIIKYRPAPNNVSGAAFLTDSCYAANHQKPGSDDYQLVPIDICGENRDSNAAIYDSKGTD